MHALQIMSLIMINNSGILYECINPSYELSVIEITTGVITLTVSKKRNAFSSMLSRQEVR